MKDVFISHASEDKEDVARDLAETFSDCGLAVWYDEYSLVAGDSLRTSIDRGLGISRYGVVILSPSFFSKNWPPQELDALHGRQMATGQKIILPVLHNMSIEELRQHSPMLAGYVMPNTKEGLDAVVQRLLSVIDPKKFANAYGPKPPSIVTEFLPGVPVEPFGGRGLDTKRDNPLLWLKLHIKASGGKELSNLEFNLELPTEAHAWEVVSMPPGSAAELTRKPSEITIIADEGLEITRGGRPGPTNQLILTANRLPPRQVITIGLGVSRDRLPLQEELLNIPELVPFYCEVKYEYRDLGVLKTGEHYYKFEEERGLYLLSEAKSVEDGSRRRRVYCF